MRRPRKQKALLVFLFCGAGLSFSAAHHHRACRHGAHHGQSRRAAFEAHIARVCVDAAREAQPGVSPASAAKPAEPLAP